ncbi:baseplate wedge subunit [Bacillus phage G]|uniref:Gp188 n=1 Tax=Bacillus phage G TaxID=2884420 RepID=G3MBQ4_9CAUD|nr:baseplate wedge subunit [Bacillus phage G]AEO93448.1 gp188 [Bacillus phage G]
MEMKTLSEIAIGLISHIHDALPEVDTKEGTFVRDVFVDPVSTHIAELYQELKLLELSQSIVTATGADLDKLARNFFIRRKEASYSTGKIRFYLGLNEPKEDIFIPQGSVVGSPGDANTEPTEYMTSISASVLAGDKSTYHLDVENGLFYIDVDAISLEPGSQYNVGSHTITLLGDVVETEVTSVTNPFPFTGGTDAEDDLSLQMRVSMAITGVNIGTKDGYMSFMMKQSEVHDVVVVGAGDPLMTRDNGEGGMVDIYVRAEDAEEYKETFYVSDEYTTGTIHVKPYDNIIPKKQPIIMIDRIIGRIPNSSSETGYDERVYINGSNYKKEKGSNKYYRDILWNFADVPVEGLTDDDLLEATAINVLNVLLKNITYLKDIKYDIDWQMIDPYNDNNNQDDQYFYRGYYNDGLVYLITSRNDENNSFIGGRNFISRDKKIYERIYVEPDFEIERDTTEYAKSYQAKDSIKWLSTERHSLPTIDETLHISYSWNSVIDSLQQRLEEKKILTADVLIKQANEIPIEIKMKVVPDSGYNANVIRNNVVDNISSYINEMNKMGGAIDRSDLVYLARGTEGVEAVDISNVHLSIFDSAPVQKIELKDVEYMKLESIYIEVLKVGTIV